MQIQNKRRMNDPNDPNGYRGNNYGQQNGGWENQGNNNGWGQNQGNNGWGSEYGGFGNIVPQMGFNTAMAIFANQSYWGNDLKGYDWVQKQKQMQNYQMINANQIGNFGFGDLADVLNKQITMMEPSPAQKKLQQLRLQGKTFYDDRFPPNNASLCGQYGSLPEWKSIQWKKISDILPKALIFKDRVQPADIKQGQLGDCYFLAGLAALAQRPDRIFNLFLLKQTNPVKYYSVKMLYKGKWMTIDMDQFIPALYNQPAFSKSVGNELWVLLLQKAWAKMYTSFKRIEAGYPQQALHDLTGAPIKNIYLKQSDFNKQIEWNYLMMASQKQYAMVASSRPGSDRNKSETGIVLGHAYTFLSAIVLNYSDRSQRIVQLRNPWGKGESKGRWSDNDQNWNLVSPQEKQRIGFSGRADDGIFFMTYDAFIQEFRALTVAEINDNASYIYKSMKDRYNEGVYFKIEIVQPGNYSFQIDKTPERSFTESVQNTYSYPQSRLQLGQIHGNSCKKLQGIISSRRTLYKSYQLTPGVYIAFARINFNPVFEKDFEVNLAVYAQYVCDIEIAPRNLVIQFTGNPNIKWNPQDHLSKGNWNYLGNSTYRPGDSGWGNEGNDNGWGNINNNNSNNGWGNNNNNNGGDDGWGNYFKKVEPPKPHNDGWGDYFQQPKPINNNGWGNQNINNGWGSDNSNNGWGHQQQNNNINNTNDGWGNYFDQGSQGNNSNNNGWGSQQQNNGWGNGNNGW